MVAREAYQEFPIPEVGTAVADPGDFVAFIANLQGDGSGAHVGVAEASFGCCDDGLVSGGGCCADVHAVFAGLDDVFDGNLAGDVASRVATHAVGHQPQTNFGIVAIAVFVLLANVSGVRAVAEGERFHVMKARLASSGAGIPGSAYGLDAGIAWAGRKGVYAATEDGA